MNIEPKLEEAVLAYLFGDGEADPGLLVTEGAAVDGFAAHLARLEGELVALKQAADADTDPDADGSLALARLSVLREEVARWQARPAEAVSGVPVAHGGAKVISLAAERDKRTPRWVAWTGSVVALAAAIILAVVFIGKGGGGEVAPRISVAQAQVLAVEVGEQGFGFAGAEPPSARDRGYLAGIVRDLSAPYPSGALPAEAELEMARTLARQALVGLDFDGTPESLRGKVAAGCRAFLRVHAEVAECKGGLAAYERKRDAALAPKREATE